MRGTLGGTGGNRHSEGPAAAYSAERNSNRLLIKRAHDYDVMLKGAAIAALALTFASQVDQYLSNGRYTDVAFAMLRQIRHSFGL